MLASEKDAYLKVLNNSLCAFDKSYYSGMTDCIDLVLDALSKSKGMEDFKNKIECLQILIKAKKIEILSEDLGAIKKSLF